MNLRILGFLLACTAVSTGALAHNHELKLNLGSSIIQQESFKSKGSDINYKVDPPIVVSALWGNYKAEANIPKTGFPPPLRKKSERVKRTSLFLNLPSV